MNYHNITYPDMNNGDGLRVVLWLSGCNHHCKGCQNPQTWDEDSGIPFDEDAKNELCRELERDYISGITFTGGDPLFEKNLDEVLMLINMIRKYNDSIDRNPELKPKTIWMYTGYTWEELFNEGVYTSSSHSGLKRRNIIKGCDVVVDGPYIESLRDVSLKWRGSSNQRVIDCKESLKRGTVVLWSS